MAYREVFDLDYAMPMQRKGGITLSLMTNGGEVEWLARDLLQPSTLEGLRFFNDEYVDIMNRYPGEFAPTANAHALEEVCRPVESSTAFFVLTGAGGCPRLPDVPLRCPFHVPLLNGHQPS